MNSGSGLTKAARIYGIIITVLMVLIFGSKLIGSIIENGTGQLKEIAGALIDWYDDPTAFFVFYLVGYAMVWWKPLWGSAIIITTSVLVAVINFNNMGFIITSLPVFVVGLLYMASWHDIKKRKKSKVDRESRFRAN